MSAYDIYKTAIIIIFCYLIYIKIAGFDVSVKNKSVTGVCYVVSFTALSLALSLKISEPYKSVLLIIISSAFFTIKNKNLKNTVLYFTISFAVSFTLSIISITVSAAIFNTFFKIIKIDVRIALLATVFKTAFLFLIYRIKFKIILPKRKGIFEAGFTISGIVIIIYSLFREGGLNNKGFGFLFLGILSCGTGLYYWIKKESITEYNRKVQALKNLELKTQINNLKSENEQLQKIQLFLEKTVHTDSKKLPAYQEAVEYLINNTDNLLVKKKAYKFLNELKTARIELADEISRELTKGKILPSTGMELLDGVFKYYNNICLIKHIEFELLICGDISKITGTITQSKLETLVSNLLDNAIKAVDKSENKYRSILACLWSANDGYGLCVEDSGVSFGIETLSNLIQRKPIVCSGKNRSGIGYLTIFEIIEQYGASFLITEKEPLLNQRNKIISIKFNGKNENILKSYRVNE